FSQPDYVALSGEPTRTDGSPPRETSIEDLSQKAADIEAEISERKAAVERFNQKEVQINQRLETLHRKIHGHRMAINRLNRDMVTLDQSIDEQSSALAELEGKINSNSERVGKRITALYKLSRLGPFPAMTSADSIHQMLARQHAISVIIENDEEKRQALVRQLLQAKTVAAELALRKTEKAALEDSLNEHLRTLDGERTERRRLLSMIRADKSLELAAVADLKQSAEALNKMLEDLQRKADAQKAAGRAFVSLKGLLEMPVRGKVINFYGPYRNARYNVTNFRSGIDIRTDRGEPIRAVAPGTILFADWFKGYGNMIILDHGGSYYTLYAHIEDAFKTKGDRVDRGEVIATVGDSASMTGPGLYFEVRHHGKPENPMLWLKKG
ncbi:MAG: peptidoglycan DD-metalloendopeptidase family protein, partial [Desulfobacterales bacterium]